jgi:hypothetical protein
MKLNSFTAIVTALDAAAVRYLVAGGLAVNAHGYLRFTKDMDIVLDLSSGNIKQAFAALGSLGYRPNVPIDAAQFADPGMRARWIEEKNMQVLQFWSDAHIETPIDVFVTEPFDFEREYERALVKPLTDILRVRFVSLTTLIQMKQAAGRPQDLADVDQIKLRLKPGD